MELTMLRQFRAVALAGHMTKAARAGGVTQPALSAMVKKLEEEVGAALLHRTGRGVELTEAGRVFLVHAEDALRRADGAVAAVRELMGLERGSIRIGGGATATSYLLPPIVSAVRAKYPGLRFYVREAGSSAVAAAVASGELDLGIVTLPVKAAEGEELVREALVVDELRLIGKGKGREASGQGIGKKTRKQIRSSTDVEKNGGFDWKELEGVPVVAFEAGTAVREMIDRASAAAGVRLNVVMELRSIEGIKRMVAAGIGVGFVSKFALEEGEGLRSRDGKLGRQMAVVKRRERPLSAAAGEFERVLMAAMSGGK